MLLRVCVILLVASQLRFCQKNSSLDDQWKQWKNTYRKEYKDKFEEEDCKTIWRQNMCMIEIHNKEAEEGKHSYTLGMNHRGDVGTLDIEIWEEMADMMAEMNRRNELLEEITDIIAGRDLSARKYIVDKMIEMMTESNNMSRNHILDKMSEWMVASDIALRKLILDDIDEMLADYDKKARKHILKKMEQTLAEYNRMSRKLILEKMASTMQCGRMSQNDILGDMTEAIDEYKGWSRKLILEEMEQTLAEYDKMARKHSSEKKYITGSLPKSIDYREEGLVTQVRDQGLCGSCWAFSAAGALEGQLALKTGRLLELSPQNLVDCVGDNDGCNGGYMSLAFKYVIDNGGITSEEDYPYVGKKQQCRYQPSAVAAQAKVFKLIPKGDEGALAKALFEVGPLSVAINSNNKKFQFYKSGVYYNPECVTDKQSHAMLLVGYGETAKGEKYWIVKNSWGEEWGEKGYIRIARNHDNHCGIASEASYPLIWNRLKSTESD